MINGYRDKLLLYQFNFKQPCLLKQWSKLRQYQTTKLIENISKDSDQFDITNGTRQGSVLSPYLFAACYLDPLLVKLRKEALGCHIAGVWLGACGYADDICLLANNRLILQKMVTICENYGKEHNLIFSTDPVPTKSKTKCIMFCRNNSTNYPAERSELWKHIIHPDNRWSFGRCFNRNSKAQS